MSYYEALADNIRIKKNTHGDSLYFPKCHICAAEVLSYHYIRSYKYTCQVCRMAKKEDGGLIREDERCYRNNKRLDNVIGRISKVADIGKYEKAISWVRNNLHRANWFQSTEEMMVALELIKRGVKVNHQVKINKYRVDFVLPDDKVVLEIDGEVFHRKDTKEYDKFRDNVISLAIGLDWEIIRIPSKHINKNVTKLYSAIKAVQRDRKRKRALNNGLLPKGQSDAAT